jgi:hypothetical protein
MSGRERQGVPLLPFISFHGAEVITQRALEMFNQKVYEDACFSWQFFSGRVVDGD